ncbi:MAG: response regulator [Sulfuricella sp.]|nr:response regulator [Sulfuricella sp.]
MRALLVDDDEFLLEFLGDMLQELGMEEVLMAANGEDGLAIFNTHEPRPDLLLCDLSLPGMMDGIDFLRCLAEQRYDGGVILISGTNAALLTAFGKMIQSYGMNMWGALNKPVEKEALATIIGQFRQAKIAECLKYPSVPG